MAVLRRIRRAALLLCLPVLLAGCGRSVPERPSETVRDLIADLDLAEIRREPGRVDLGTPEARPLLRKGWSGDEGEGARTFVWSDGPESEMVIFLARVRDVPLTLKGSPYSSPSSPSSPIPPAQEVTLLLNGAAVGRVAIQGEEARTVLPARALREGENHLVLRYAWTRVPNEESGGESRDRRHLAVAWDFLRFDTGVDEQGRVRAAGDQLAIPFGLRVDTFLRLPPGAVLAIDGLRSRDGEPGELRVTLRPEGGAVREVARLRPDRGPAVVKLEGTGTGPARLSLLAVAEKTPSGSGLVLRRPAVAAPPGSGAPAGARTAATAAPASPRQAAPAAGRPPNVIIYLVDALRADHLGCYGYSRPVSPRIDAFAREAVLFRHTVAQSSWTRPSTTTILTGLYPRTHKVNNMRHKLSEQALTLAEMLRAKGYRTAGFVTNYNVSARHGLGQGFETYKLLPYEHGTAADVNAEAAGWLENGWTKDTPFFLYLHTLEPHAPYNPAPAFRQRFAPEVHDAILSKMEIFRLLERRKVVPTPEMLRSFLDLYDAEIATNDAAFGDLIDLLVRRGLWENTVIVFISDHGEEFLEHGSWQHGSTLHNELLNVPLIVRAPGTGPRAVQRQVQQVDVVPTVLDLLGLPVPPVVEGHSLVSWMIGGALDSEPEAAAYSWLSLDGSRLAAVTTPAWRLIDDRGNHSRRYLYDRRTDPGEHRNVADQRKVRQGYLWSRLRAEERPRKGALQAGEVTMDAELRKQLQALGYLR
ncbi:MAG TPA: sulfatase [Thermoanaerobaculia bacterium]|jgi:arylsulfatase A-like enzyme|nr:sulfatase [Thermoanaerobaculia bacterium]